MSDNAPKRPAAPTEEQIRAWLAYEFGEDIDTGRAIYDALKSIADKHPDALPNQEVADIAGHDLALLSHFMKRVDDKRKAETAPYRDGQSVINRWFEKNITAQMVEPETRVRRLQTLWTASLAREQRKRQTPHGTQSFPTETWKPKLVDFAVVPEEYKMVDWDRVRNAMRARDYDGSKTGTKGKPTAVIPGIEWVTEFAMRNR